MSRPSFKRIPLSSAKLLNQYSINLLAKKNIETTENLYIAIQAHPESIADLLKISIEDTEALGTLLLDYIDIHILRHWVLIFLSITGQPIKINSKRRKLKI